MKQIKFDLPIDGAKVRNVEELRDHFNTEILDLHKSGLLAKWLRSQRQPDLQAQVEAIAENSSDQERLDALCRVFSIELDSEIIQQLTQLHDQGIKRGGISIDPLQIEYESFYEKYNAFLDKFKSFTDEFEDYKRFLEYCRSFKKKDTVDDIALEFMRMVEFVLKGKNPIDLHVIKFHPIYDVYDCEKMSIKLEYDKDSGVAIKTLIFGQYESFYDGKVQYLKFPLGENEVYKISSEVFESFDDGRSKKMLKIYTTPKALKD